MLLNKERILTIDEKKRLDYIISYLFMHNKELTVTYQAAREDHAYTADALIDIIDLEKLEITVKFI
jgi:hypothetical protein